MTCSLVRPAALLSTQHIPAARLRSQRTPEFPGAGRGQGPLPRDRESPCRSHWASFCAAWYPPLKLPLVEQIALKHRAISCDEAAPCILGYLFGGAGVVENDLRKHAVRPAAYPEIHVVLDLTGDDIGVGPLRGKYQMDTKSPPQSCNRGQSVFYLCQQFLILFAPACLVQHLRHLVTGEYQPWQFVFCRFVVCVNIGGTQFLKRFFSVFQYRHKLI